MSLQTRLDRLERLVTPSDGVHCIIWESVVADEGKPTAVQPEVIGAETLHEKEGWSVNRDLGEDVEDFKERLGAAAKQRGTGITVFLLKHAD